MSFRSQTTASPALARAPKLDPSVTGDFSAVQPIEKNVQLVRELKQAGHYIIISTSRLMNETGGNVGKVIASCGYSTLRVLDEFKIPYDEIHFGQVHQVKFSQECSATRCASALSTPQLLRAAIRTCLRGRVGGVIECQHGEGSRMASAH